MAVVKSLDCAYHTARAEVLAQWPSALESPALQDELLQLQGGISHQSLLTKHSDVWQMAAARCRVWFADKVIQLCQQYSAAARNVKQELQDEALHLQADFRRRLEVWNRDMRELESSRFAR